MNTKSNLSEGTFPNKLNKFVILDACCRDLRPRLLGEVPDISNQLLPILFHLLSQIDIRIMMRLQGSQVPCFLHLEYVWNEISCCPPMIRLVRWFDSVVYAVLILTRKTLWIPHHLLAPLMLLINV